MIKGSTSSSFVGRVGQRRQVVLPKSLCDEIGIAEGDFVEVSAKGGLMLVKPKRLVDADDVLSPAEANKVRHGLRQMSEGKTRAWRTAKHELGL